MPSPLRKGLFTNKTMEMIVLHPVQSHAIFAGSFFLLFEHFISTRQKNVPLSSPTTSVLTSWAFTDGGDQRGYGRAIATSATRPMIISRTATSTLKRQGFSYVVTEPCFKRFRLHPH